MNELYISLVRLLVKNLVPLAFLFFKLQSVLILKIKKIIIKKLCSKNFTIYPNKWPIYLSPQ